MAGVTSQVLDVLGRQIEDREVKLLAPGKDAMRKLLRELEDQIVGELQAVAGDTYAAHHLKQNLAAIERHLAAFENRAASTLGGLLDDTWQAGSELLPAMAAPAGLYVGFGNVSASLLDAMKEFSTHLMRNLRTGGFDKIRGELILGMMGQKTPHEVVQAVKGNLETPGVFKSLETRAETIVRTELGRVYSAATQKSMEAAVVNVPELKKQWWHAGHPKRPRRSHLALHGQIQPVGKPFLIGTLAIEYPRSPKAPISEVINCGCELVPWHPKWADAAGEKIKLPIFNERGEQIARRGPRTGFEEDLTGKFEIGQVKGGK